MKTEFMVQLDGASSSTEDRILIIGATNRPYELDDAILRCSSWLGQTFWNITKFSLTKS